MSRDIGVRTVDVGNAQLSMHSIREMSGTKDCEDGIVLFKTFFTEMRQIDDLFQ